MNGSHDLTTDKTTGALQIPVGISACLLGQEVRFNGGHKRSRYCLEVLQECFRYESFCPEMAIGLGVPRQPIRLVGDDTQPQALGTDDPELNVTDALLDSGRDFAASHEHLCGYILTKGSPSCGMERVKVYHPNGNPNGSGVGLFTRALMEAMPWLPVEEEARLNDPVLRENFILRVFALHYWKKAVEPEPSFHKIQQFHTRYKYTLMAHSYPGYQALGRLLSDATAMPLEQLMPEYLNQLMGYLKERAGRKSHTNTLLHIFGYLKKSIDSDCKQELVDTIEQYRRGEVHLVVPLTLLKHYLKRHGSAYINEQAYLDPYPHELGLRNYI